jgi:hypothetical protein
VLNKNNYGYISPSDFNLYAQNAQMELFEEYFSSYNQIINAENARSAGTDYADMEQPIAETMESFLRTDYLALIGGNRFSMPSLTTTGFLSYYLLDVQCRPIVLRTGLNTAVASNQLIDNAANFILLGVAPGDLVLNRITGNVSNVISVLNQTTLSLDSNIFTIAGQQYAVISSASVVQAEKVNNSKISLLLNSNLTPPSNEYPAYTLQGEVLTLYPRTIMHKGQVEAKYFRFPKVPKWTYITLSNGEPVFDQSQADYQDFELPPEDEYKLITRILQYCGVSIRETEVTQFSMAKQQQEQNP